MELLPLNGYVFVEKRKLDYIRFGHGKKHLILLPGLGDGLKTVRGTAMPMALMYRNFAKEFTVWSFSRGEPVAEGASTRDMARELKNAMDKLGIGRAHILGVSMGGMIAQHLAADSPEKVDKLVLAVTCGFSGQEVRECVGHWFYLAQKGDHTALLRSNLERIYSEDYCRKNGWMVPLLGKLTKPKSYDRFFAQARACMTHTMAVPLQAITAPTLVIGGEQDRVVSPDGSRALAKAIPGARLYMYEGWGHGLYEEAPDFNRRVLEFLKE